MYSNQFTLGREKAFREWNFHTVGEMLFPVNRGVQSSKRSSSPGWPTERGSRLDVIGSDQVRFFSRTSIRHDPPGGCHVVLEPLHEPLLKRARINKKEQT